MWHLGTGTVSKTTPRWNGYHFSPHQVHRKCNYGNAFGWFWDSPNRFTWNGHTVLSKTPWLSPKWDDRCFAYYFILRRFLVCTDYRHTCGLVMLSFRSILGWFCVSWDFMLYVASRNTCLDGHADFQGVVDLCTLSLRPTTACCAPSWSELRKNMQSRLVHHLISTKLRCALP